jgi:FKBP-type peptidyl-prolyl cis-trans isomerase FklB
MKQVLASLGLISFCLVSATGFCADAKSNTQLKDKTDKISYSIGMDVGKSIDKQGIQINPDAFVQGLKDAKGKNSLMTEDEMRQILLGLQTEIMERQKKLARELSEKNLAAGEKFLADNKKKQDIKTLPSGLHYTIIKEGQGASPKAPD